MKKTRKLQLDLASLEVESFQVAEAAAEAVGTVRGHAKPSEANTNCEACAPFPSDPRACETLGITCPTACYTYCEPDCR